MRIKNLVQRIDVVTGKVDRPGDILEVDEERAARLIAAGQAEAIGGKKAAAVRPGENAATDPAKPRRGRPPGSKSKPKAGVDDGSQTDNSAGGGADND